MSNVSKDGKSEQSGDKLDQTELLRMFIETLRKTIDNFPNLGREKSNL